MTAATITTTTLTDDCDIQPLRCSYCRTPIFLYQQDQGNGYMRRVAFDFNTARRHYCDRPIPTTMGYNE